jgi:hypothetical protein
MVLAKAPQLDSRKKPQNAQKSLTTNGHECTRIKTQKAQKSFDHEIHELHEGSLKICVDLWLSIRKV